MVDMPAAKSQSKKPAKLHSFTKQIVTGGEHFVNGRRRTITEDQMRRWVKNHESMQAKGYRLPAPFKHRKDAVPMSPKAKGSDGFSLGDSSANAGFWKRLWVEEREIEGKKVPVLFGELSAPGDPNDPNTPAGKVGTTVEECSVYAVEKFKDGKGQEYDDSLLHVAAVVNPVEMGQPNFEYAGEVDDDALILSMSTAVPFKKKKPGESDADMDGEDDDSDDDDGMDSDMDGEDDDSLPTPDPEEAVNDLEPLLMMLKKHQGPINLPLDTTAKNLAQRLWLVVNHTSQLADAGKETDPNAGSITQPPAGTQPKSRNTFAMSTITDKKLLKTFEKQDEARRATAKSRVQALATAGVLDEDSAKELNAEIDSFEMSVSDSEENGYVLDPLPVDKTLKILEKSAGRENADEFGIVMSQGGTPRPVERPDARKSDKLTPDQIKEKVGLFTSTARR